MNELSFTLKSWAEFLSSISAVLYAWPLPEATSTTVMIDICTACEQPAIDDLFRQTRNKCHVNFSFSHWIPCINWRCTAKALQASPKTLSAWARFISVKLHSEESSVAFSTSIGVEFSEGSIVSTCTEHWIIFELAHAGANLKYTCIRSFNLNFRYMAIRKHTYTRDSQCNYASVGLAQAHPN